LPNLQISLHEVFSAIPAAVYACDADGFIVYSNRHARELWGDGLELQREPWAFLNSSKLYATDGTVLRPEETPAREVLATGLPVVNRELVLERSDGSRIDVLANAAPWSHRDGPPNGVVNIFQNVTEVKCRERERENLLHELERSNEELSRFSYAVSHDLRAPVRSIRTLTQLLIRRNDTPGEDEKHLTTLIEQGASGMERLIESLLRYAQVGRGEIDRQRVSANSVVDSVRVSLAALISESSARITCSPLPVVDADIVQLEQLFQNLAANAIKYRRPDVTPFIEIEGETLADEWRFAIRDNGRGVLREHQKMIFEPLKRLNGNDTPGTGLGLAICRMIVARHGGRIWVESEGADRGATFHFTLSRLVIQSQANAVSA
jgi:light-regulated signal transduction histidine kinase (bacteriophytochrome)